MSCSIKNDQRILFQLPAIMYNIIYDVSLIYNTPLTYWYLGKIGRYVRVILLRCACIHMQIHKYPTINTYRYVWTNADT